MVVHSGHTETLNMTVLSLATVRAHLVLVHSGHTETLNMTVLSLATVRAALGAVTRKEKLLSSENHHSI